MNICKKSAMKSAILAVALVVGVFGFTNANIAHGASNDTAVVDYRSLVEKHPDMAKFQETMTAAMNKAQEEFKANTKDSNDAQKQEYANQLQQNVQNQKKDYLEKVYAKIDVLIKAVAEAKGIKVVIDKGATYYCNLDITDEVLKKYSGK